MKLQKLPVLQGGTDGANDRCTINGKEWDIFFASFAHSLANFAVKKRELTAKDNFMPLRCLHPKTPAQTKTAVAVAAEPSALAER